MPSYTFRHPVTGKKIILWDPVALMGLAILFLGLWANSKAKFYSVLPRSELFMDTPLPFSIFALIISIVICAFIGKQAQKWTREPISRSNTILNQVLITFAFWFFLAQGGLLANGALDFHQPQTNHSVVKTKRVRNFQNGDVNRFVEIQDWHQPNRTITMKVPAQVYNAVTEGTPIQVITKKGLLGQEWLVEWITNHPGHNSTEGALST